MEGARKETCMKVLEVSRGGSTTDRVCGQLLTRVENVNASYGRNVSWDQNGI